MMLITMEPCSAFAPHYQPSSGAVLYVKSGEARRPTRVGRLRAEASGVAHQLGGQPA